jgi:hypothetical protein
MGLKRQICPRPRREVTEGEWRYNSMNSSLDGGKWLTEPHRHFNSRKRTAITLLMGFGGLWSWSGCYRQEENALVRAGDRTVISPIASLLSSH